MAFAEVRAQLLITGFDLRALAVRRARFPEASPLHNADVGEVTMAWLGELIFAQHARLFQRADLNQPRKPKAEVR